MADVLYDAANANETSAFSNGTLVPTTLMSLSLYSRYEKRCLRIIAIMFASLSLLAGTIMLYWYIRLQKRTFRHTYVLFRILS